MKKTIYFLFLLLLCSSFASASLSLDKTLINFNAQQNEEQCELITVSSSDYLGEISLRDVWAENSSEDRNINFYTFTAADKGISISYIDTFADFENQTTLEICLSGAVPGDYKGALIFTPEAQNSTIIEVGTWLIVHVDGEPVTTQDTTSPNGGGGSGGSRRNTPSNSTNSTTNEFENLGGNPGISNEESTNDLVNPQVDGEFIEPSNKIIYLIILAIVVLVVLIAIKFRK